MEKFKSSKKEIKKVETVKDKQEIQLGKNNLEAEGEILGLMEERIEDFVGENSSEELENLIKDIKSHKKTSQVSFFSGRIGFTINTIFSLDNSFIDTIKDKMRERSGGSEEEVLPPLDDHGFKLWLKEQRDKNKESEI